MTRTNIYRASFRKDRKNESPEWFTLVFAADNYELARDHAMHCASMEGLVYCTVQRLTKAEGEAAIDKVGGKFLDASGKPVRFSRA